MPGGGERFVFPDGQEWETPAGSTPIEVKVEDPQPPEPDQPADADRPVEPKPDDKGKFPFNNPDQEPSQDRDDKPPEDGGLGLEYHAGGLDSSLRAQAIDAAETRLEQELHDAKGFKGFITKIWKSNAAFRQFYRQKYIQEAIERGVSEEDVFAGQVRSEDGEASREAHDEALEQTFDRLSRHDSLLVHEEAGERVESMEANEANQALQAGVRELIRQYMHDELDADSLREARTRLVDELQETHPGLLGGDKLVGDNLITLAEQAKALLDQQVAEEQILSEIKFFEDQLRVGQGGEANLNRIDRFIDRLQSTKLGSLVNETTLATGVAIAYSIGGAGSTKLVGGLTRIGVLGFGASVIAGLRENARYKQDRSLHSRQSAVGTEFEGSRVSRRERMDQAIYETRGAAEMSEGLREQIPEEGSQLTREQAIELITRLADARSRTRISDSENVNLISYSSLAGVESERLQLDLAMAEAQAALRGWFETASEADRTFMEGEGGHPMTLEQALEHTEFIRSLEISDHMDETDRRFARMKRVAVGLAMGRGLIIGAVIGEAAQEAGALVNSGQQGAVEGLFHHDKIVAGGTIHQTFLRSLLTKEGGSGSRISEASGWHFERTGPHAMVKLPDGMKLHHTDADGGMQLIRDNKVLAEHIHVGRNGFSPESKQVLDQLGIMHLEKQVSVGRVHEVVHHEELHQYLRRHPGDTIHVQRDGWNDNDTPGIFDKNEHRLYWGGRGTTGIDSDGNYVLTAAKMTPDGSYHGPISDNAQELIKEGKLKMIISASDKSQAHPFEIKADSQGNFRISPNSVVGRSLFSREGGQAHFNGRLAEVVHQTGESNGVEHVRALATLEGRGVDTIRHTVRENITHHEVRTVLVPTEHYETDIKTDIPFVVPVVPRREMEPPKRPEDDESAGGKEPKDDDDDQRKEPKPPPGPEPEPEPKPEKPKLKQERPKSQVDELRTNLVELPKYVDDKMKNLRKARSIKQIDKIVNELSLESLTARLGKKENKAQLEVFAEEAAAMAEARKAELALEARIMKAVTDADVDAIFDELVDRGDMIKRASGRYAQKSTLGQFALVARNIRARNLELKRQHKQALADWEEATKEAPVVEPRDAEEEPEPSGTPEPVTPSEPDEATPEREQPGGPRLRAVTDPEPLAPDVTSDAA